jgi:hypothetical protein
MNQVQIREVSVGLLIKGGAVSEQVTCTLAGTDYSAAGPVPAGTKYVVVYAPYACLVACGEATSATVGFPVPALADRQFPVVVTGVSADDTIHVQCGTGGGAVRLTYVKS